MRNPGIYLLFGCDHHVHLDEFQDLETLPQPARELRHHLTRGGAALGFYSVRGLLVLLPHGLLWKFATACGSDARSLFRDEAEDRTKRRKSRLSDELRDRFKRDKWPIPIL